MKLVLWPNDMFRQVILPLATCATVKL